MTDPQQQDPLAALEELLKDSKGATADPQQEPAPAGAEEVDQASEEQKRKEIEALEAQQQQKDAEDLRNQIAGLQEITNTPQEQARLAQKDQQAQQQTEQSAHQEEYKIRQLGHTKV